METIVERQILRSGDVEDLKQIPQLIFGALVALAGRTVAAYHSDFYSDAMWVTNNVTGPETVSFWYAYDENGTHIGTADYVRGSRRNTVRVTIELADRTARITIAPVAV